MTTTASTVRLTEATEFYEGPELCREYFRNDLLWFGTSVVEPGEIGGLDAGHARSWEVFYCTEGEAVVDDGSAEHVLRAGDALTIPPGVPHTIHNRGSERVVIVWAGGPGEEAGA
ncbi:cupin domain-containing protein [Herbiconiux sp. KACC 21604]|uniref:cupin domain-containing protein n=1 Tax=unclassified Herbiconiux TaxID=2618217 RepID=UPI001490BFB2|nr:cupin domain-containing protein [Herbiconiux sp. SALV-R1]QJU55126.1 cupin domain-containing protein [Herbiconiux sp. SALV-R1]WPO86276.1 cupin domain-containing protein [Herbiconiux sp. KACC 21604]